jgi:hypothetical protein
VQCRVLAPWVVPAAGPGAGGCWTPAPPPPPSEHPVSSWRPDASWAVHDAPRYWVGGTMPAATLEMALCRAVMSPPSTARSAPSGMPGRCDWLVLVDAVADGSALPAAPPAAP